MRLLGVSCLFFLISNLCVATTDDEQSIIFHHQQCQAMGDKCRNDNDCCSDLVCYSIQGEKNVCWSTTHNEKLERSTEDLAVPFYFAKSRINYSPFLHNRFGLQHEYQRKKLEWDSCRFHEDCGEGYCCYLHFRFRSLPKSFCRPNRSNKSEVCEPLTRYRSFKQVEVLNQEQQPPIPSSLPASRTIFYGRQRR